MRSGKCCDFISCLRFTYLATHSCAHKPPRHPNHYSNRFLRIYPLPHPARKSSSTLTPTKPTIRPFAEWKTWPSSQPKFLSIQTPSCAARHPLTQLDSFWLTLSHPLTYIRHPPIYPNTYSSIQTHNHAHSNPHMHLSRYLLTLSPRQRSSIYPDTH